jgi:hypothetical protein
MALTKPRAYQIYDIDYKQAVRVVSTTNITLGGGAPNSVDGVTLNQNDRVLVTGQTGKAQNGIYYVTTVGSGSNGTWARSVDANTTGEILAGMIVMVTEGGQYSDTQWKLLTDDPITIGVTELSFAQNFGVPYTAATIPPTANLVVGSQWFDTDTNVLYEYMYDGTSYYWIDITGPAIGTNGAQAGTILANGNSNVSINDANGIVTISSAGTANVISVRSSGANVDGNITITYAPATTIGTSIQVSAANTQGGTGYADFLKATNTSVGATNPNKSFRLSSAGAIEIINSAYSATLLSLSDTGALSVPVAYQVGGKQAVNGPAFSAYPSSGTAQTITSGSQQKILFGTEEYDTNSNFASSRFTPTVEGYYQLNAAIRIDSGGPGTGECMIVIYKNGAEHRRSWNQSGVAFAGNFWTMSISSLVYANGTGDFFEIYAQQTSGADRTVQNAGTGTISWFNGCMARGA